MSVKLIVDNAEVPIKKVVFSDGGSNIKLEVPKQLVDYPPSRYYSITVDPTTPVDNYAWEILQVVDAIEHTFGKIWNKEYLYLPYLPHGRADRAFEYGNGHPLSLFLDSVGWMFNEIFLTDPHSDYYSKWSDIHGINTIFQVKEQWDCFIDVAGKEIKSGDILIAPDKGSLKKIYKLQQKLDVRGIVTFVVEAGKKRDVGTGRVVETTLPEFDYGGKTAWIVDDLCENGGTFIPLAEKLKSAGAKTVNLYVTHMIAPKGLSHFRGIVDKIYAYQTVAGYINLQNIEEFNKGG